MPVALAKAALRGALAPAAVTPNVAAAARGWWTPGVSGQFALAGTFLAGLLAGGLGWAGVLRQPDDPPAAAGGPDTNPAPAPVDLRGDPLPAGARARLGTMRFRHGRGSALAFTPDGQRLITFGGDRTLRFWDVVTGRLLREQTISDGATPATPPYHPTGAGW